MRRLYQVTSLVFIAVGAYIVQEARGLTLFNDLGPGPGFFPFWLGIIFTAISVAWLAQVSLRHTESMAEDFVPGAAGIARMISIVAALALFTALVNVVGFKLMMFLFLLFLLYALGRQNPIITFIISLAGSFGVYFVFKQWLDVHLPESSIEILRNLGL